jgi:gliding motility-associated-like protein
LDRKINNSIYHGLCKLKLLWLSVFLFCLSSQLQAQLTASFSVNMQSTCLKAGEGLVVRFTDETTGGAHTNDWSFGDGTISKALNPVKTYTSPGVYYVNLTTKNPSNDVSAITKQIIIYPAPDVVFTTDVNSGCSPLKVNLTDKTATPEIKDPTTGVIYKDRIASWQWEFGDGNNRVTGVPSTSHTYTLAGNRRVILTLGTEFGCKTTAESAGDFIKVIDNVVADFYIPPANSCKYPITVQAANFSPTGLSYKWEVTGTGPAVLTNSTDFAPLITFVQAGSYRVTLTISTPNGCSDVLNYDYVLPPSQVVNVFAAPDSACDKTTVNFINQSNPDPINQAWFIDGVKQATTKDLSYQFPAPGSYMVRLESNFGTCNTSFEKSIRIDPLPVADFIEDQVASCEYPLKVRFNNKSSGNTTKLIWNFGDGTTLTEQSPFADTVKHSYNSAGVFTVVLTAITAKGCFVNMVKNNLISIQPPIILKTNLPDSGCAPLTVRPSVKFNIDALIISWKWSVKDKKGKIIFSSILKDPGSIVLTDSGKYDIIVDIVSSTGCNRSYTWVVKVGELPKDFDFSAAPVDTCASVPFKFNYLGPDVTGFKWKFSNGDSVDQRDFTKNFKKIDTLDVKLTVYQNGCPRTIEKPKYIKVRGVVALFSVLTDCVKPLDKVITDGSLGLVDQWEWQFGDGGTRNYTVKKDTLQHRYAKSGPYTVTLKVSGAGCTYIDSTVVYATNENGINFESLRKPVCIADTFLVLNSLAENASMIRSYDWDYGCGFTGQTSTANPKVNIADLCKYPGNAKRGLYTMQLRIIDLNGCVYTSPQQQFMVGGPIADYISLSAISGCENLPVSFQDRSSGDGIIKVMSRLWDFGDGSPIENILSGPVQHIFTKPGTFNVKLVIADSIGCSAITAKTVVKVSQSGVDFYPLQNASCLNKIVQLQVVSPTNYISFKWDLGDGKVSFIPNPRVSYTQIGRKDISLTVVDGFGCESTVRKPQLVEIDMPAADISVLEDSSSCPPFPAQFLFGGKFAESYEWDFGDGSSSSNPSPVHTYSDPGTYIAKLKVISPGGCEANSASIIIYVEGPTGTVDYPNVACEPYDMVFNVASKNAKFVTIDYGDGYLAEDIFLGSGKFNYRYGDTGMYTPNIFVSNGLGCKLLLPQGGSIKAVSILPVFKGDVLFYCDRGGVNFTDLSLSNDQLTEWNWDFGDLDSGRGNRPYHFYGSPGLYHVKMTVTSSLGCVDTLTRLQYIDIQARPDIAMNVSKVPVCEEDIIQFSGIEVPPNNSPIVSWFWDFTNGNSASDQNPEKQLFRKAGNYPVRIHATNQKGCSDTLIQNLVVHPIPSLDAGPDSILCLGKPIQLKPKGAATYEWFSGPTLSCTNCEQPFINPVSDAIYFVKGTSAVGCSTIDSININVIQPTTVVAPADTLVCIGDAIRLQARGTLLYSWTPANGLSRTDIAGPTVKPMQTTTYTVTGKDAYNCFVTKDDVVVTVIPLPTVNAGRDTTIMAGNPLQLKPVYSPDVSRVQWVPALFLNCSDCKTPVTTPSYSATYTLFAYTPEGCMSKDVINVFASCTGDNLFIPNTFSPNGDGINEVFYPRGRGIEKIRSMKIFSRWGQLIYIKENFLANDQNAAWNGKRQGQFVTPDVYVYMIDLVCENGNIITLKGDVTLIR